MDPPLSGYSFVRPQRKESQREKRRLGSLNRSSASALAEETHSRRVLGFISAFSLPLSHLAHFREAMAILQGLCAEQSFIGQSGEPAFVRRISGSFTPLQNQQKTELPFNRCLVALERTHFPPLRCAISECVTAAISAACCCEPVFLKAALIHRPTLSLFPGKAAAHVFRTQNDAFAENQEARVGPVGNREQERPALSRAPAASSADAALHCFSSGFTFPRSSRALR